jgi:hypothetical protein
MTNSAGFDFTKFVPGFDFLKNLTPGGGAASSAAPGWVAPTLDPEELDKRIQELKTVQFWLEQNAKAVGATIQALEVQRMTLNTLKGMNMSFNDLADSLKAKPQETAEAAPAQGVDPSHWWGALTDQFQHIATHAMNDMAHRAHAHAAAAKAAPKTAARKPAARKTAARKTSAVKTAAKSKR